MKIAYAGLNVQAGKVKYNDRIFTDLAEKFNPAKLSPYYFEFLSEDYAAANLIALTNDRLLDLLILDIEKIENRLTRTEDPAEKAALDKCQAHLETQQPVCNQYLEDGEKPIDNALGLLSLKPTVVFPDAAPDADAVCRAVMEKAGLMFFYTVGKQEVHAWMVEKGTNAVTCAGKIHTDLARGFIKAELVSCEDMLKAHNMNDARAKGLTRLVNRDYPVPEKTVLEIRFNV